MLSLALALVILQPPAPPVVATAPALTAEAAQSPVPKIEPGQEIDFVLSTAKALKSAASEKRWGVFVSILLMAFLSIFSAVFVRSKELRERLRDYTPEVAIVVSVLGYVAVAMGSLPPGADIGDWMGVILPAVKTGLAAVGSYEVLVKRLIQHWWPRLVAFAAALWAKLRRPKGET